MYHVSAQGVDERMINVHYYYYYYQHHYYYYTGSYRIRRWRRCLQHLNDNHVVSRTGRFSGDGTEHWSRQRTALDGLLRFPHLLAEVGRHWHWHMVYCEGHRPIHKEGIGGWGWGWGRRWTYITLQHYLRRFDGRCTLFCTLLPFHTVYIYSHERKIQSHSYIVTGGTTRLWKWARGRTWAPAHCISMSIRYNHILTSSQVGQQDCGSGHGVGRGLRHLHEPDSALLFGAPLRLLARATRRPAGHRLW